MFVDSVTIPSEVASGGIVDVSVDVVNAALGVNPLDDDRCSKGIEAGYEYEVVVEPGWAVEQSATNCLTVLENNATHEFSFDAPDTGGTYTVDITVEGTGTGFSAGGSFNIVVPDEGGSVRPDPDPIDGGNGENGGNGDAPAGLIEQLFGSGVGVGFAGGLAFLLVVLVLLIAVGGE